MGENDEGNCNDKGYFRGTEPIREAIEADLDVDALQEVVDHLEAQLRGLVHQRNSAVKADEQEALDAEIRTIELNLAASRQKLKELRDTADSLVPAAIDREAEINEGQLPS